MPMARPTMLASASGELKTRCDAEPPLQAVGDLEDAALALDLVEARLAGAVGHVLAEDDDARVARHLVAQAGVEQVDHRLGVALGDGLGGEAARGRIDVGRVDVERGALRGRAAAPRAPRRRRPPPRGRPRSRSAASSSAVATPSSRRRRENSRSGSRFGVRLALGRGAVERLVVGERVRVGADDVGVHEGRPLAGAAPGDRLAQDRRGWRGGRSRPPRAPAGWGRSATSLEMLPPAVCTSTGTEIA